MKMSQEDFRLVKEKDMLLNFILDTFKTRCFPTISYLD